MYIFTEVWLIYNALISDTQHSDINVYTHTHTHTYIYIYIYIYIYTYIHVLTEVSLHFDREHYKIVVQDDGVEGRVLTSCKITKIKTSC